MSKPDNSLVAARLAAEHSTDRVQERNRLWWEQLPMTYVDWDAADRALQGVDAFRQLFDYVRTTGPFLHRWFARQDFSGLRLLDLGCGSGVFSSLLAERGGSVTAVDLTEAAVRMARETADRTGASVAIARMDAEKLAFGDGTFDFVYSWGVLHHTGDMESAVAEAARVLKPGGRGIMMVYHRHSVVYYGLGLFWLLVKGKLLLGHTFRTATDFYTDGFYHRYLSRPELAAQLARHGLSVVRMHVTQYKKRILPFLPASIDEWMKARFGMCLIAEFTRPMTS